MNWAETLKQYTASKGTWHCGTILHSLSHYVDTEEHKKGRGLESQDDDDDDQLFAQYYEKFKGSEKDLEKPCIPHFYSKVYCKYFRTTCMM